MPDPVDTSRDLGTVLERRYWLTDKGWAATTPTRQTCQKVRGCHQPATGQALSYGHLGYVPACTEHREEQP